jgi:hypothetical protein
MRRLRLFSLFLWVCGLTIIAIAGFDYYVFNATSGTFGFLSLIGIVIGMIGGMSFRNAKESKQTPSQTETKQTPS